MVSLHSSVQDLIQLMEEDQGEYPDSRLYHFPSQLRLDALPELVDISVSRTLLTTLLTALKANGKHRFSLCVYYFYMSNEEMHHYETTICLTLTSRQKCIGTI